MDYGGGNGVGVGEQKYITNPFVEHGSSTVLGSGIPTQNELGVLPTRISQLSRGGSQVIRP